jgi:hypothetical protein
MPRVSSHLITKPSILTNPCPHFIELPFLGTPLWSLVDHDTRSVYLCAKTALWTDAVTSRFSPPAVFAREPRLLPEASRIHGGLSTIQNGDNFVYGQRWSGCDRHGVQDCSHWLPTTAVTPDRPSPILEDRNQTSPCRFFVMLNWYLDKLDCVGYMSLFLPTTTTFHKRRASLVQITCVIGMRLSTGLADLGHDSSRPLRPFAQPIPQLPILHLLDSGGPSWLDEHGR